MSIGEYRTITKVCLFLNYSSTVLFAACFTSLLAIFLANLLTVAGITPSEHAPAGLVLPREVTIERSQSLLPGVLPHATPSSSAPTRSSDPVDAKEEQNVVENKPVGNDDGAKPANPIGKFEYLC